MGQLQILIAGISATGKSDFGRWLADTKGFIHVDMELPDTEPYSWRWNGLRKEWDAFYNGSDRAKLPRALKARTSSVVLNWGFPPKPCTLSCISALQAAGVGLWWFDGDRAVARRCYKVRAKQQLSAADARFGRPTRGLVGRWVERTIKLNQAMNTFDTQYNRLINARLTIEPLFCGHVIKTLRPDGSFMDKEEILSRIMSNLGTA
jgi:hypothetical protein